LVTYQLVEPSRGDAPEIRTYGGQGTELPARMWLPKPVAMQAIRHFVRFGGRNPDQNWEFDFLDPDS
jgi:hypothetical protein